MAAAAGQGGAGDVTMNAGDDVIYNRIGYPGPQSVHAKIEKCVKLPGKRRTMYHVRWEDMNALVGKERLTLVQEKSGSE